MKKSSQIISLVCIVLAILVGSFLYFHIYGTRTLILHTKNETIQYRVERAITPEEQKKGLMYRKHLKPQNGMIFIFTPPRVARMWMKNTLIPLDMIFFDRLGRVVLVHHNAIPHDETIISSIIPVAGVLEINAGEAKKLGIKIGTTLDLSTVK